VLTVTNHSFSRGRFATILVGAAILAMGYALSAPRPVLGTGDPDFSVVVTGPVTAGAPFTITVTARDGDAATDPSYTGTIHFTTSDLHSAPPPVLPADYTFTGGDNGTHTFTMGGTLYTAGIQTITAAEGTTRTGTSGDITVVPGDLHHFVVTPNPATLTAGHALTITATAYDPYGNVKTNYGGGATVSGDFTSSTTGCGGSFTSPCPAVYGTFSAGTWSSGSKTAGVTAYHVEDTKTITVSDSSVTGTPTGTASASVVPGDLHHFTVAAITSPVTAGDYFDVTATAWDPYGNIKTNYGGGAAVTGTFGSSPGYLDATTDDTPAAYGSFPTGDWTTGSSTAHVTAYLVESGRKVTVSDGSPKGDSNTLAVQPNDAARTDFETQATGPTKDHIAFNGQPLDTKVSTSIYSVCVPPAATSTSPCAPAGATGSTGVRVLVRDAYGNLVRPTVVSLAIDGGATLVPATANIQTSNGIADFGDLPTAPATQSLEGIQLRAQASSGGDAISRSFQIANDVKACANNVACVNKANDGTQEKIYNQITATSGQFFGTGRNVLLRTQFYDESTFGADATACGPSTLVGQGQEALPEGAGAAASKPTTKMLIVISAAYLKSKGISARSATSFNACVGARWIGTDSPPTDGWTAKALKGGGTVKTHADSNGVYWGLARPCGSLPKGSADPCIDLATKNAADVKKYFNLSASDTANLITNGDIAIVIRKLSPWDGKGSVYS
jgi:hypothetical protein